MGNEVFVLAIIFLVIVVPMVIVFHYSTKWKSLSGLSDEEQKTLEDLWQHSERMRSRVTALETILDDTVPAWRSRA